MKTPLTQSGKPFPVLKDKLTGLYPWTETLEHAHEKHLADTLPKMPLPHTVAKTVIDAVENGSKAYVWAGYPSSLVRYFVRWLPASIIDMLASKQDSLHLIPRPVNA